MEHPIAALSDRLELAPIVAAWLLDEFRHSASPTLEVLTAKISSRPVGQEETFVLFDRDRPVGTASLTHKDLAARPDLTPWLSGVLVQPAFRGQGYASALVRRVEAFAQAAGVSTLWLYTWTAESLYLGLGWERIGLELDPNRGREVVLMRRSLTAPKEGAK